MKIKLIGSPCTVSVMKSVKIVLYILDELKKCHFHYSFFPSPFNQHPFIFIFIYLLSVSCCIHSSAWRVSYLVENEQFVPWRFQLFGSLRDSSFGVSMRGMKSRARKKRESIGGFSPINYWVWGRGYLKSAAWQLKSNREQKRLLKEVCNFTHLHHYQDRFIAVLILPDMLEEKK